MNGLYKQVEGFVIDSFKIKKENSIPHFIRTAHWIKELKPDADEALLIAAVAHDIERAFRQEDVDEKKYKVFNDNEFLRLHSQRGAEIIGEFLKSQGCEGEFVNKVMRLVEKHEVGGDDEQNLLKDADSISFFENNAKRFLTRIDEGKDKVKGKFEWMFNRITAEKAKEIVRGWYEEAIRELDKI